MAQPLWAPTCHKCGEPEDGLLLAPGDDLGPRDPARLTVRWTCARCRAQNYVPTGGWVRRGP